MMGRRVRAAFAGFIAAAVLPAHAADGVELTTRVSGMVEEVLVSKGQKVKKGAVLLRLNTVILQARLDEAAADEDRSKADEADAKRELARAQELYDRTVSSTTELEAASLAYARAQAALAAAVARRVVAQKNLADAELKAPFDGVVSALPAAPGVVVVAECQPRTLVVMKR
jgi:RND family efflux transporter MFP subunit